MECPSNLLAALLMMLTRNLKYVLMILENGTVTMDWLTGNKCGRMSHHADWLITFIFKVAQPLKSTSIMKKMTTQHQQITLADSFMELIDIRRLACFAECAE